MEIKLKNLTFRYDNENPPVLNGLNLHIKKGETVAIIGPSGIGKTTLLKMINGMLRPEKGNILLDRQPFDYSQVHEIRKQMGYVMQESGLYPHMNVEENVSLMARIEGWSKNQIEKRLREIFRMVHLTERGLRKRKPWALSGGQKQRVSLARALFFDPPVLLLDEPFTFVDTLARSDLIQEFLNIKKKLKKSMILVTHDLAVACRLGERILLLNNGKIEQDSKMRKFISSPRTPLARSFVNTLVNKMRAR